MIIGRSGGVENLWGPHSVNRFANSHKDMWRDIANSSFWDVGTEAVDTFTVNWAGE